MVRTLAATLLLSCLAVSAWAQAPAAPATPTTPASKPLVKPAVKKTTKVRATKPAVPANNGPCQIGVISAIGEQFVVQKVGITVFNNEKTEVPIDAWNLNDLVVARVRAAAPGTVVRKIPYAKGAFEPYENPPIKLFRNSRDDLTAVVREIAANDSCEEYVVATNFTGQLEGTNQTLRGIGILNHGSSLLSRTRLFINVSLDIFDGQTFAIRKKPSSDIGSILAGGFSRLITQYDPNTELDNSSFPQTAADAANSAQLRDRTRTLLAAKLDKILPAYLKLQE